MEIFSDNSMFVIVYDVFLVNEKKKKKNSQIKQVIDLFDYLV